MVDLINWDFDPEDLIGSEEDEEKDTKVEEPKEPKSSKKEEEEEEETEIDPEIEVEDIIEVGDEEDEEEEDEEDESKDDKDKDETLQIFSKALIEKGLLNEDFEFDGTEEGFFEKVGETIDSRVQDRINAFEDQLPEDGKDLLYHLSQGGSVKDFQEVYGMEDYSELDISKESNQKKIITEHRKLKGDSEDEISDLLTIYADKEQLEKKAKEAQEFFEKDKAQRKKEMKESFERAEKEREEQRQKTINTISESIEKSEAIKGYPIAKSQKKQLLEYMTKPTVKVTDAQGKTVMITPFQAAESKATLEDHLFRALLRMNNYDLSKVEKKAISSFSSKVKKTLQNQSSSSSTLTGALRSSKKSDTKRTPKTSIWDNI